MKISNLLHTKIHDQESSPILLCLLINLFTGLQVSDTDVVRLHGLDAEKELCEVVEHSPGEGVVVLTPGVLQVVVALVVEHLIGGQVHRSVQKSKSREKPAQAAEDKSLNQSDDVEKSPALDSDTVAGEEDGDGAVNSHGHGEHQEPASVAETHAVVDVGAVMIKLSNTPVTDPAVLCSERSDGSAGVTQAENVGTHLIIRSMVLPLVIIGNLFDRLMIVIRILRQKSGILLVSDEKGEPHDEIDEDEDVVEGGQEVPGDGDAPEEVHGVGP